MYVYLFRCMSHLGMLIRVTARAVLNIVSKEANIMDTVVLIASAFPAIFVGPIIYLAAPRDSWQLITGGSRKIKRGFTTKRRWLLNTRLH